MKAKDTGMAFGIVGNYHHKVAALENLCSQRGARMQLMKKWMEENDHEDSERTCWQMFLYDFCDEPESWFDDDGVPK